MIDHLELFKHGILVVLVVAVYFLPSIIARVNGLRSSIYLLNLLFGWTVLGWLIALSRRVRFEAQPLGILCGPSATVYRRCGQNLDPPRHTDRPANRLRGALGRCLHLDESLHQIDLPTVCT